MGCSSPRDPGALQNLLLAPETAQLLDGFLNGTSWKLPALVGFLTGPAEGPELTWHQVFADVDAVLTVLSQFMEVCVAPAARAGRCPQPR